MQATPLSPVIDGRVIARCPRGALSRAGLPSTNFQHALLQAANRERWRLFEKR
jgi:hypothetical protein